MRININVPEHAISSSSKISLDSMPSQIVELTSTGELVLVELQGSLEIDDPDPNGGQILGKLEFHPDREDRPTLLISHHRLEGKIVPLTKPLAVLERETGKNLDLSSSSEARVMSSIDSNRHNTPRTEKGGTRSNDVPSSPTHFAKKNRSKEDAHTICTPEKNRGSEWPESPTMAVKRGSSHTLKLPPTLRDAPPESSSPLLPPPCRGSELDYSSPIPASKKRRVDDGWKQVPPNGSEVGSEDNDADDAEEWMYKRETAVYFDVVCIIRKKILFSKRPEPVVRLQGMGEAQAREVLGYNVS